ncbi:DUF1015 domain-containing protein [Enterococcus caccae]|uniref:DUF1015 domain-containing protein n=1 Tax=Enterococcus caccae ATCC BAA-1240 TaxID=1158612 RepID=R3X9C6_9ENTE|nr:DUF1015 family protein [Enterococcus caccae]EOL50685.1 hypothetical protein UC7_00136 [Enterococcus caccae ATCC BAA-1240]EOT59422.1 hypothetical protein I580_02454 [Enterococcus caccae ATCC BAA-1240]OJG27670.1 hypothetical protein RU98_GL002373 [Enterococcus caccae]
MVMIHPFKSIRPASEFSDKIATLPYDVLNSAEARELGESNPYSYLHIDKAEIDLPETLSPYDDQVYAKAASNLQVFLQKQWLVQDEQPLLYLYELTMNGRAQTGLVTCTSITDYTQGKIKKHEFTRPEKEVDRIRHIEACDANTSPIFLTYRKNEQIQTLTDEWKKSHDPIYDFTSFHEVTHRVWLVDKPEVIEQLVTTFAQDVPALYIADGHHRTESAVKVGQKKKEAQPNATDTAEFNYFLSVIFPKEELEILDYNRVLNVPIEADFFEHLETNFTVTKTDTGKPTQAKTFGMYLDGQWFALTAKDTILSDDPVDGLDVSLLQNHVFAAIFDIQDVRTDKRIDFVGGIRGMQELEQLVDSGQWSVAFAVYPTTMDDLLNVADAGKIMPPKSTWFEPKLLSGLFVHDLETKDL